MVFPRKEGWQTGSMKGRRCGGIDVARLIRKQGVVLFSDMP